MTETSEPQPKRTLVSWELQPFDVIGHALEEIRVTPENSLLFRFSGGVYIGFRSCIHTEDETTAPGGAKMGMAYPDIAVYTFPDGVGEEALAVTRIIAPGPIAPAPLAALMTSGELIGGVFHNSVTGLPVPASDKGRGWYLMFGTSFLEVSVLGMYMHERPKVKDTVQ